MPRFVLLLVGLLMAGSAHAQSSLFDAAPLSRADLDATQSTYLGHLEALAAFDAARIAPVNLPALDDATVAIALPDGEALLSTGRIDARSASDYTWYGAGATVLDHAVLVVRDGRVTGTVRTNGQLYTVRPLTGTAHAVVRLDESKFIDHEPDFVEVEQAASLPENSSNYQHGPTNAPAGADPVIHIVVGYTPLANSQVADIEALVQLAIDETNLQYTNSNISASVALAHTYMTTENGSGSFSTDVPRFAGNGDGFFDEIHGYRDTYGGDVAILITRDYGGSCGRANVILADHESEAFGAAAHDCATGYYTFGHEVGHLQGARHNPETDGSTTPFAYGHGKYWPAQSWRTVMSYNCPGGCTRIPWWSNPDVNYTGTPTGDTAQRDNSRVLDETAMMLADFRPDPIPVELVAFDGLLDDGAVRLSWTTSSETNNAGFEIQRRSPDGWTALGFVDGYGTTTETQTYAFSDAAPLDLGGAAYYRLKQIDFDGAFEHSNEIEVALGVPETFALNAAYPNPFNPSTTLRFDAPASSDVTVEVLDMLGRQVTVLARGPVEAGRYTVTWDAAGVPSGVYIVRLTAGTTVATQRVTLLK